MSSKIFTVAKKELWSYFSSPTAFIFLGTYLLVSLFTFFWVEKFFSRNIADLRPLFEWMPLLLIFLSSTLTMRMWSEERRMGTVEFLLTLPIKTHELVLGKFLACMGLVAVALALTLGLAVSVSLMGPMDWGPVVGAYVASLLLASAYISIGLYVSSRNQSQIVSLIVTSVLCFAFFILGSDTIVNLVGNAGGEIFKLFGSGSRFESISRGVIDARDIYYYLSLAAAFLTVNTFTLERLKWSNEATRPNHTALGAITALVVLNVIGGNVWLHQVKSARLDITQNRIYSISDATKNVVNQLEEPLLIRGYFSSRTHPLLAPLIPTIRDLLTEYQIVGDGKILTEVIDPRTKENEHLEAEANRVYNIEPVPFQIADRHSSSMVASYFNIVVKYGDQFEVMGFNDLIDVKYDNMGKIEVELRNLEYDLTSRMRKVMQAFKNTDNFWANLKDKMKFVGYVSEGQIPDQLKSYLGDVKKGLEDYSRDADGKLEVSFADPLDDKVLAKDILENYGFKPQMSLLSPQRFYFYLTLQHGDTVQPIALPSKADALNADGFKSAMDAALKRMTPGFLRTVGFVKPAAGPANPMMAQFGGHAGGGKQFRNLEQKLESNYNSQNLNLESGTIPADVDILVVMAPENLKEKEIFALDQFLMKGGTIILSTSRVGVSKQRYGFTAKDYDSGLNSWLAHHGIEIPKELVLDEQNSGFPAVRRRMVQGMTIQEPYLAPYPYFIDVRAKGLNSDNAITSGLGQVVVAWGSPILVDEEKNKGRSVINLIKSSANSWRSTDINIEPDEAAHPETGFAVGEEKKSSVLAAMVEGQFTSYFLGKESPLLAKDDTAAKKDDKDEKAAEDVVSGIIEKSPEIARLIVFASNEFAADDTLQIAGMVSGTQYINPLQAIENSLDWSTEDRALLSIRSRGQFARTLKPMDEGDKSIWEIINYVIALLGLLTIYGLYRTIRNADVKQLSRVNLS